MPAQDSIIRVAVAQLDPELGSLDSNLEKHVDLIHKAIEQQATLVLFPELSLTGYSLGSHLVDISRHYNAACFKTLRELSKKIVIVVGFVESGYAAQIHNSVLVFSQGENHYLHRKLNLPTYGNLEEGKHFAPGRYIETFELHHPWQFGTLICSDAWNPALVHLTVLKGALLLLIPVNSANATVSLDFSNPEEWDLLLNFYARMYGVPVLMSNRVGKEETLEFWGGSRIIDARGRELIRASSTEEEVIVADINYTDIIRARTRLPTVRDSNLDLIHREIERLRNDIGYPSILDR